MERKFNFWEILVVIAAIGIFCILIPIFAYKGGITSKFVIQLLSIIISWPVAIIIIVFGFIKRFQNSIGQFLENLGSMKLPGGVEFQTQSPSINGKNRKSPDSSQGLSKRERQYLSNYIEALESAKREGEKEREELEELYNQELWNSISWKFEYLNIFFVANTKAVLLWFTQDTPQTEESYHLAWRNTITDKNQRDIILSVLKQHGMVQESEEILKVTPQGYAFLGYIGILKK